MQADISACHHANSFSLTRGAAGIPCTLGRAFVFCCLIHSLRKQPGVAFICCILWFTAGVVIVCHLKYNKPVLLLPQCCYHHPSPFALLLWITCFVKTLFHT